MAIRKLGPTITTRVTRPAATPTAPAQAQARVTDESRRRMIEENAYYRALRRGFQGGDPFADWVEAEREINATLRHPH